MTHHFFLACFLLFALSIGVLLLMFFSRLKDMRAGVTNPKYFKTYDLETQVPSHTRQMVRNYANLFETPVLFYAIIGLILSMGLEHTHLVVLAYAYPLTRCVHSLVHLTSNKLYPRMITFWTSIAVLSCLWLRALVLVMA